MIKFQGDVGLGSAHIASIRAQMLQSLTNLMQNRSAIAPRREIPGGAHILGLAAQITIGGVVLTRTKRVHKRAEPPFLGEIYSRRWLEIICVSARAHTRRG
jgi:hypothetical protein